MYECRYVCEFIYVCMYAPFVRYGLLNAISPRIPIMCRSVQAARTSDLAKFLSHVHNKLHVEAEQLAETSGRTDVRVNEIAERPSCQMVWRASGHI